VAVSNISPPDGIADGALARENKMAEQELEKRIAQLEDIEAIRQLKARYCLYVDQRKEDAWVSRAAISSLLVLPVPQPDGFGT
jgi:hypothetical protein